MKALRMLGPIAALVLASLSGCGPDAGRPSTTPIATTPAPADIQATLAWMTERTMTCAEIPPTADARDWKCSGTSTWPDGSVDKLAVGIKRDGAGATHLTATLDARETAGKELCPGLTCDAYTGLFSDTVALAPITGDVGPAIGHWIDAAPDAGRARLFGPILVDYRPALPILTMIMEIAAVP